MKFLLPLTLWAVLAAPSFGQEELRFAMQEGGQHHHFFQSPSHGFHALLRPKDRLIVAWPGGNSGVAFWWKDASLSLLNNPEALPSEAGQRVGLRLQSDSPKLQIEGFLLDSIRVVRDQTTEGWKAVAQDRVRRGGPEKFVQERFRNLGPDRLIVERSSYSQGDYRLELRLEDDARWSQVAGKWVAQGKAPLRVQVTAQTPFAPLKPYRREQLLKPGVEKAAQGLSGPEQERFEAALRGLNFLSSQDKYLAGSWRFLTYFGRDTAMSALLLRPILSQAAFETAYFSLLKRLSPDGDVAHEESLGCWQLGDKPVYDYGMVDDDFMLPLLSEHVSNWSPDGTMMKNFNFVLRACRPYASSGQAKDMVKIHEGSDVGDWRDSREGMGWGRYSFSVNGVLAPAALASMGRQLEWAQFRAMRSEPEESLRLASAWKNSCRPFQVQLKPVQVRQRLKNYLATLTDGERQFYLARPVGSGGPSLQAFLDGAAAPALQDGLGFHALSLDAQAKPVEVMHSDDSFLMFLGQPDRAQVEQTLRMLELEFPVGLMTGVGPVVANPAYSLDERHARELGRGAYHGTVVWGWQSALMTAGLLRQRELQPELVGRIDKVLLRLWECERNARTLANSELWTFSVESGDWSAQAFGQGTASTDESNPVQLWSCVYPALVYRWQQAGLAFPATR